MNSAVKAQMLMQDAPILQKSLNYRTTEDFIDIKRLHFTVHSLISSHLTAILMMQWQKKGSFSSHDL